jgi:putative intracellular protease/amidase
MTTSTAVPLHVRLFALAGGALALLACTPRAEPAARPSLSHQPEPRVQTTASKEKNPMTNPTRHVLIAMTSHDKKGATGKPTGVYLPELAEPYEVFVAAGYDVDFASVGGGRVPLDGVDRTNPVVVRFLADEALVSRVHASLPSSELNASQYDSIFFAGGHGAMWDLPDDRGFQRATAAIYERGGVVAAVCHGPAALVNVQLSDGRHLVQGRAVSAFTNDEERAVELEDVVPFLLEDTLRQRGATFVSAPLWQPRVAVSERLVTGQNPASSEPVARAVVELLKAKAQRE